MKHFLTAIYILLSINLNAQKATITAPAAKIEIHADQGKTLISKHIYGHFSEHLGHCIYDGLYVGKNSEIPNTDGVRNDVIDALKEIKIPNLRWPGGCFADEYHWMNGIGENRAKMINTHWGGVIEDNSFGTHEFLNMCQLLDTQPYITANVGSGSVEEMSKWVEYITFDGESPMANLRKENGQEQAWKLEFLGIGNESWGCGGNMTADFYADQYRRYQTYARNYGENRLKKIACGPNSDDYHWTETIMKSVPHEQLWGLSLHYYTVPGGWSNKGSATDFDDEKYAQTIEKAMVMNEIITRHDSIMTIYDPEKKVALVVDEWGAWYDVEKGINPGFLYQQNTLRDAVIAGVTLNIFNNHADRVKMANLAQMINVLQAIILTDGEKICLTPTYHIFNMYKVHQDATLLPSEVDCDFYSVKSFKMPRITTSSSIDADGIIHISIVNVGLDKDVEISCNIEGKNVSQVVDTQIVTSKNIQDHNTFDEPENITLESFDKCSLKKNQLILKIPAKSIVTVAIK